MKVKVSGSMSTGTVLPEYIEKKVTTAANKYFKMPVSAFVHFKRDADKVYCSITINEGVRKGTLLVANAEDTDARRAFDESLAKAEHQMRKYKEKLQESKRKAVKSKLKAREGLEKII